jgi:hypothetical protein
VTTIVDALVVTLGLNSSGFVQGQKQLQENLGKSKENANQAAKQIEASGARAAQFFTKLRNEAIALFAVFTAGRGIKDFVRDIITGDAAVGRVAHALHMSVQELSAWRAAAEQTGGSAESITATLTSMASQFEEFRLTGKGLEGWIGPLNRMGVSLTDGAGKVKDYTAILMELADKFREFDRAGHPEQATAFGARFGFDQNTVNMLMKGSAALKQIMETARQSAPSDEDVARAQKIEAAWAALQTRIPGVVRTVVSAFEPAIDDAIKGVDAWLGNAVNRDWLKQKVDEAITSVKAFWAEINVVVEKMGGWKLIGEVALGMWAASKVAPIISAIVALGGALFTALANPVVLAALLAWGVYYTATQRFKADTREERDTMMRGWSQTSPFWEGVSEEEQLRFPESPASRRRAGTSGSLMERGWNWLTGRTGGTAGTTTAEQKVLAQQGMDYFTSKGWSKEQAAGILGNLQQESGFGAKAGAGSAHEGAAQWSAERKAQIEAHSGKPLMSMSYAEQLEAIHWELTEGRYKGVGDKLKTVTGARESAALIDEQYEVPGNYATENPRRSANAEAILQSHNARTAGGLPAAPAPVVSPDLSLGMRATPAARAPLVVSSNDNSTAVQTGPITIHTAATDAPGIARSLKTALHDTMRASQMNRGLA